MGKEAIIPFSVASFVEDVLQQNGVSVGRNIDLVTRKLEEEALRRYEATTWLRKMVGVVAARDLPEQPSEEEFRFGLRSGMILCNVLNKVQPGSVPRVVECPNVSDGAALSAYQYFENVRNFLDTVQEMGIPTFEASDLEQGGKSGRVVNCVLALKSYSEWKQTGSNTLWKFDASFKSSSAGKFCVRKNSELFTRASSKSKSSDDGKSINGDSVDGSAEMAQPHSLNMLVQAALSGKKPEEVPMLVEAMLSKVVEEFERRITAHNEPIKTTQEDLASSDGNTSLPETVSDHNTSLPGTATDGNESLLETASHEMQLKEEEEKATQVNRDESEQNVNDDEASKEGPLNKQQSDDEKSEVRLLKQRLDDEEAKVRLLREQLKDEESKMTLLKQQLLDEENPNVELFKKLLLNDEQSEGTHHNQQLDDTESEMHLLKQQIDEEKSEMRHLKEQLEEEESKGRVLMQQVNEEETKRRILKQQVQQLLDQQQRDIQDLKHTLHSTKEGMQSMQTRYFQEFIDLGKHLNYLANAASGYNKVLEENRKLYNQVQDLKGNIRVYCRVRPFLPGQESRSNTVGHMDEGSISITTPSKYGKEGHKTFAFNKVFGPSVTQEEVFADTRPLIRSVLDGYNVCIFAYGQTGSGKTHTMTGPKELTEESQGVNFRALNDLFLISEQRKDTFSYEVSVQMMEIYNEQVRDLLVTDGLNKKLEIRNSSQNGLNVPDANVVPVASTSDVIDLMSLGHKNRAVSSTSMNDRSSRSHSCVTVHVQGRDLTSGAVIRGCMHLVDLAGSERVNKSEVTGDRLKEAQHINKSLAALGDVISSLAQKNAHVPYRNSKLTQLLQDSLGGQAKTLMFVHISPEPDAVGETLSTLKFAERVASVELGAAKQNSDNGEVRELREQVASLKAALAKKEGESLGRKEGEALPRQHSLPYTPERQTMKTGPLYADIVKSGGIRKPVAVEDARNVEVHKNSAIRPNKSFDLQQLLMNSPPRPPLNGKGDEVEFEPRDGDDTATVNKPDMVNGNGTPLGNWVGDDKKLSDQKTNSKIYPESRFEVASTDGSEDLDATTSDSSEIDFLWQSSIPKVTGSSPNGLGSKLKKPSQKVARSPDHSTVHRSSSIPSFIPSPSRKTSNGATPPLRNGRQPVPADSKRRMTYGK